jgi:predicted RNA-binding protein YlqC (UPF0109 family)
MVKFIEEVVKTLVDNPDQVVVNVIQGRDGVTYDIHVAQIDLGKVIGKQGRIANALRSVAKAASVKNGQRIFVEINP